MALKQELQVVRDAILDLYLDVKVRSNEELNALDDKKLAEERQKLLTIDTKVIVDYVRTSIEILLNLKMEDNRQPSNNSPSHNMSISSSQSNLLIQHGKMKELKGRETPSVDDHYSKIMMLNESASSLPKESQSFSQGGGYEEQMRQYEADIRTHISIEQQLKIYIDNLKYKMECEEKDVKRKDQEVSVQIQSLSKDKQRLEELMNLKDKEVNNLKNDIQLMKQQFSLIDKQNEKFKKDTYKEAEDKFKSQIVQIQDELDMIRSAFKHQNNLYQQQQSLFSGNMQQFDASQQIMDNNLPMYKTGGNEMQSSHNGIMLNNGMQLINFYHPQDDQALINAASKGQLLNSGPSSHKKNQLSLQSNKSNGKVMGYIPTASTHQSTNAMRETPNVSQPQSMNHQQPHGSIKSQMVMPMNTYQNSFTNPRNSTAIESQHSSQQHMADQMQKKTMIKNHSEYFVTNPGVKEIVESHQKSYRNQAQKLANQGVFSKKQSLNKSPDKSIQKSNLYKLTTQKSQEKLYTNPSSQKVSNRPSKERNQTNQASQNNISSNGTILNNQPSVIPHHRRSKTGVTNQWSLIPTNKNSNNNSYNRSRDNSQSLGRPQSIMPVNNNASSFIKPSHSRTISASQNNQTLQKSQHDNNFNVGMDENIQRTAPNYLMSRDSTTAFHTLNDEQMIFATDERMIFNTVDPGEINASSNGGIQNIKSMQNLKATIMGNQQSKQLAAGKFKINEKEINQRNNKLTESQIELQKKLSMYGVLSQNQRSLNQQGIPGAQSMSIHAGSFNNHKLL